MFRKGSLDPLSVWFGGRSTCCGDPSQAAIVCLLMAFHGSAFVRHLARLVGP